MTIALRLVPKAAFCMILMVLASACTPVQGSNELSVSSAYQTAGVIPVKPYTRTIFSSHNF